MDRAVLTLFQSRRREFCVSADPSHRSLPFLLQDWLGGFPADCLPILLRISGFFTFSFFVCFPLFSSRVLVLLRQIKLTRVGFRAHVEIASRIVSHRLLSSVSQARCSTNDSTHTIYARTNRYKNSLILFGLNHFQWCGFVYFVYAWFSCMSV